MEIIELADLVSKLWANWALIFIFLLMRKDYKDERDRFLTIINNYVKENK